jgi:hypothetical protein
VGKNVFLAMQACFEQASAQGQVHSEKKRIGRWLGTVKQTGSAYGLAVWVWATKQKATACARSGQSGTACAVRARLGEGNQIPPYSISHFVLYVVSYFSIHDKISSPQ